MPVGCAGTFITPFRPRGGLMSSELLTAFMGELSCGLRLGLKVMLVEDGPLMEGWPMGELMTGYGEGRPLMGELRVLMGECS